MERADGSVRVGSPAKSLTSLDPTEAVPPRASAQEVPSWAGSAIPAVNVPGSADPRTTSGWMLLAHQPQCPWLASGSRPRFPARPRRGMMCRSSPSGAPFAVLPLGTSSRRVDETQAIDWPFWWQVASNLTSNPTESLPPGCSPAKLVPVRDCGITPESFPTKAYYPGKFSAFRALCRTPVLFLRIMSESFPLKQMLRVRKDHLG